MMTRGTIFLEEARKFISIKIKALKYNDLKKFYWLFSGFYRVFESCGKTIDA